VLVSQTVQSLEICKPFMLGKYNTTTLDVRASSSLHPTSTTQHVQIRLLKFGFNCNHGSLVLHYNHRIPYANPCHCLSRHTLCLQPNHTQICNATIATQVNWDLSGELSCIQYRPLAKLSRPVHLHTPVTAHSRRASTSCSCWFFHGAQ
jgi:hypothetical protein